MSDTEKLQFQLDRLKEQLSVANDVADKNRRNLRDYFIGQAICGSAVTAGDGWEASQIAAKAARIADAVLRERKQ